MGMTSMFLQKLIWGGHMIECSGILLIGFYDILVLGRDLECGLMAV